MSDSEQPIKWSREWWLRYGSIVFLGQFKIPGWLGFIFAVFWGVPGWQSKFDYWLRIVRSSSSLAAPIADVLLWPYFSPTLAVVSLLYVAVVSRPASAPLRSKSIAVLGWICVTLIFGIAIVMLGWGATESYIRTEIVKGVTGVPRDSSPTNPKQVGNEKPIFSDTPRGLTPNQQRLLMGQSDELQGLTFRLSYLAQDMESLHFAESVRSALILSGARPTGIQEQFLGNAKGGGVFIEVPDASAIPDGATKLQRALKIADIDAKIIQSPGPYPTSSYALFVGSRLIQPN